MADVAASLLMMYKSDSLLKSAELFNWQDIFTFLRLAVVSEKQFANIEDILITFVVSNSGMQTRE